MKKPKPKPIIGQQELRFLSKPEVLERVGVSYQTIWRWMVRGDFPRARRLNAPGTKTAKIGWLEHEVNEWIANRPIQPIKEHLT